MIMLPVYRNSWLPEVFNDFFNTVNMPKANATAPAINVKETTDEYIVELAAPGMTKDDFDVHINADGDLTIKMESKQEKTEEDKKADAEAMYKAGVKAADKTDIYDDIFNVFKNK